jgi:hypothetical protein
MASGEVGTFGSHEHGKLGHGDETEEGVGPEELFPWRIPRMVPGLRV